VDGAVTGRIQTDGESGIDHGVDVDAPEVFANQGQTGLTAKVVGEFLDEEFGHGDIHLQGEDQNVFKVFISILKWVI
jgi:hypothetical protein